MPPTKEPSEADIVFNRASVALAKQQRLIASWLPPRTAEEASNAKSAEELELEEQEMFAPVPELLGVGATPPDDLKDGLPKRRDLSALDKLRVQLLGKRAAGKTATKGNSLVPHLTVQKSLVKPLSPTKKPTQYDSEDEEDGRASAVLSTTSKPLKKVRSKTRMVVEDVFQAETKESDELQKGNLESEQGEPKAIDISQLKMESKRKASSFLDEVLAEKARKKKKKKRKTP